jgi:hypothetical protein
LEITEIPKLQKNLREKPEEHNEDKSIKDNFKDLGKIIVEEFPLLIRVIVKLSEISKGIYRKIWQIFIKLPIYGRIIAILFTLIIGNKAIGKFYPWGPYMGETSWNSANLRCMIFGMRLPTITELEEAYNAEITESWGLGDF